LELNADAAASPFVAPGARNADACCANCGADAPARYCPQCGQDTRDRLPTFVQFMREATGRYLAFDGKLWKTLVPLLFRPGFLTRAYLAGKRKRFIGPARLFLVSSLVLFAVLRFAAAASRNSLAETPARCGAWPSLRPRVWSASAWGA